MKILLFLTSTFICIKKKFKKKQKKLVIKGTLDESDKFPF